MSIEWENIKRHTRASKNADQVEMSAWIDSVASVEVSISDERYSGQLDDEGGEFETELMESRDLQSEELVGETLTQLQIRQDEIKEHYPFAINGGQLSFKNNKKCWPYLYCLITSQANNLVKADSRKLRACFEVFVKDSLASFFGPDAAGVRTGHPWDIYSAVQFRNAREAYSHLFRVCGDAKDWMWLPILGLPDTPSYQREKDLGIDVVVWKPMPDNRGGRHYIVSQCATTTDDLSSKTDDISQTRLREWMHLPDASFCRSLATTTCIFNSEEIRALSRRAGLVFDRSRLVKIAASPDWRKQKRESHAMCNSLINELFPKLAAY